MTNSAKQILALLHYFKNAAIRSREFLGKSESYCGKGYQRPAAKEVRAAWVSVAYTRSEEGSVLTKWPFFRQNGHFVKNTADPLFFVCVTNQHPSSGQVVGNG